MSADQITPETQQPDPYFAPQTIGEIIDRLQEYAKCGLAANARNVHHARDWANALRAEVQRLSAELDSANADAEGAERLISNLRTNLQEKIAQVQRLTEESRQLRVMMQGQETECRQRERQDKVYRFQIAGKDAEIQRLRDELSRRSGAGRVEVPEIGALLLERIEVRSKGYVEMAAMLNDWIKANARLSPSPQPSADVVVVPTEYLAILESAANRFCSSCRDRDGCTMTTRHLGGLGCGAWKLDGARINALRSSTNHDSKETP